MAARSFVLLLCLAMLCVAGDTMGASKTRALGGVSLIEAMEGAPASVVAEVVALRSLGGTGYAATLTVETALRSDLEPGVELEIAWEELSPSRSPRFAVGERVLVALELLPGASIWRSRIPDAKQRTRTLAVAMRGNAFLRSPAHASVLVLQHYLALPPELREGGAGVGYLTQLAGRAAIPLASDSIARLATRSKLSEWVVGPVADHLMTALLRSDSPLEMQDALVEVIGSRRLSGLRDPLVALVSRKALAQPVAYAALAALDGGLNSELTAKLLAAGSGPYREVVARYAGGETAAHDLRSLARGDPAAEVRARAIERLVVLRGDDAVEPVAEALSDREPAVRGTAAKQLGALGDVAIPALQRVIDSGDLDAARAAVAGLAIMGTSESSAALIAIVSTHPDESIRKVATLAIGGKIGHD